MYQGFRKLRQKFNNDPEETIIQGLMFVGAVVSIYSVYAHANSRQAYAKQTRHAIRHGRY